MSNCYSCKKKFGLLNLNRRQCRECEQYYCYNCMPAMFGRYLFLRIYCKTCKILNTRPAIRSMILKLRAGEVKMYLARRKIQTDSCIEKEDLIECFFKYESLEKLLSKNKKNYVNLKNFSNNHCSSTPNLAELNRHTATQSNTPPARTPHMSMAENSEPVNHSNASGSGQQMHSNLSQSAEFIDTPERTSSTNARSSNTNNLGNDSAQSANAQESTETINLASNCSQQNETLSNLEHIKLSNIQDAQDIYTLSTRQLKELLMVNRVDYKGCVEKDELRNKVVQLWKASKRQKDISGLPVDELCKICMDAPLNSVLLECGHIVSCIDCGKQLAECPICRQYVVRVVHTFKA